MNSIMMVSSISIMLLLTCVAAATINEEIIMNDHHHMMTRMETKKDDIPSTDTAAPSASIHESPLLDDDDDEDDDEEDDDDDEDDEDDDEDDDEFRDILSIDELTTTNGTMQEFWINHDCSRHQDGSDWSKPVRPLYDDGTWIYLRSLYLSIVGDNDNGSFDHDDDIMTSAFTQPVYVGHHPDMGRGVFAARPIPKGTPIWSDKFSARFEYGDHLRAFLLGAPSRMVCDFLMWCYGMIDTSSPFGAIVQCDLDQASFFNDGHDDANVIECDSILEDAQRNGEDASVWCVQPQKERSRRRNRIANNDDDDTNVENKTKESPDSVLYAIRDIQPGEQILAKYDDFAFEEAWQIIGM